MIIVPHSKIVVVGGVLKKSSRVILHGYESNSSIGASIELESSTSATSTSFDFSGYELNYRALECNLKLSEIFKAIEKDNVDMSTKVAELAYFQAIRCVRFDLRKHKEFIGGHIALKNGMMFSDETPEGVDGVTEEFFKIRP